MEDIYFVLEVEVMKDGTKPHAIGDIISKKEAISQYHQTLASAVINEAVESVYCEVKDIYGNTIVSELRKRDEI